MKKLYTPIIIITAILFLSSCTKNNTETNSNQLSPLTMGSGNILIEEFSDIECPACAQVSPEVEELARNNLDIVRLDFYHFPLSYHKYAFTGAEGAECARDQGKGWEYIAMTFENQKDISDELFYSMAESLELDMDKFKKCLDNHEKRGDVISNITEGRKRQIPGTPSIFINGQIVNWAGYEKMEGYIKSLIK